MQIYKNTVCSDGKPQNIYQVTVASDESVTFTLHYWQSIFQKCRPDYSQGPLHINRAHHKVSEMIQGDTHLKHTHTHSGNKLYLYTTRSQNNTNQNIARKCILVSYSFWLLGYITKYKVLHKNSNTSVDDQK